MILISELSPVPVHPRHKLRYVKAAIFLKLEDGEGNEDWDEVVLDDEWDTIQLIS